MPDVINNWNEQGCARNDKVRQTGLQDMYYSNGSLGTWIGKNVFVWQRSPIVMVKSPFDLINRIAVVKKKGKKEN